MDDQEQCLFESDLEAVQYRVSAYRKSNDCERDDRGRIKVFMLGSSFVPMQQVMYRLRRQIQMQHCGPWITWDEFSHQRKPVLFDQLKFYFFWDKNIDERVYNLWEVKASEYLHEVLSKARIAGEKPAWISDENWSLMLSKWEKIDSGLKRSSPMEAAEELRNVKSQKINEESSRKTALQTKVDEAKPEPSFQGENVGACRIVQEEVTSDELENGGKTLQEQINELSERMELQEEENDQKALRILQQIMLLQQGMMLFAMKVFRKQN